MVTDKNSSYRSPFWEGLLSQDNVVIVQPSDGPSINVPNDSPTECAPEFVPDSDGVDTTTLEHVSLPYVWASSRMVFPMARFQHMVDSIHLKALIFHEDLFIKSVLKKPDFEGADADKVVRQVGNATSITRDQIEQAKNILSKKLNSGQSLNDNDLVLIGSQQLKSSIPAVGIPTYFFDDNRFAENRLLLDNADGTGHKGGYCFLTKRNSWKTIFEGGIFYKLKSTIDERGMVKLVAQTKGGNTLMDKDGIVRITYIVQ